MFSISRSLFNDLFSLHRGLDNLFERTWESSARLFPSLGTGFYPGLESYTKNGNIIYRMAIPGVDPKNVDISVVGDQVTVKGERKTPSEVKDQDWYMREFYYGQFERSFTLPKGVETDKVNASFHNGVLEISVPVAKAAALPRKIEIKQLTDTDSKPQLKASA